MGFDPRSLERLRALGRRLPERLPAPEPPPQPAAAAPAPEPAGAGRPRIHPLETESNPEQLFRALMAASADGTVPPHLLERLRELEGQRRPAAAPPPAASNPAQKRSSPSADAPAKPRRTGRRPAGSSRPDPEADLYTAFQQRLLEEDEA
jgi:hypothetical protein